jgi:hypothetical protein
MCRCVDVWSKPARTADIIDQSHIEKLRDTTIEAQPFNYFVSAEVYDLQPSPGVRATSLHRRLHSEPMKFFATR